MKLSGRVLLLFSAVLMFGCSSGSRPSGGATVERPVEVADTDMSQSVTFDDDAATVTAAMNSAETCHTNLMPSVTSYSITRGDAVIFEGGQNLEQEDVNHVFLTTGLEHIVSMTVIRNALDTSPTAQFALVQQEPEYGVVYAPSAQSADEAVVVLYTTPQPEEVVMSFALYRYDQGVFCDTDVSTVAFSVDGDVSHAGSQSSQEDLLATDDNQGQVSITGELQVSDGNTFFVIQTRVNLQEDLHVCVVRSRGDTKTIMVAASSGMDSLPPGTHDVSFWVWNQTQEEDGSWPVMGSDTFYIAGSSTGGCNADLNIDNLVVVTPTISGSDRS